MVEAKLSHVGDILDSGKFETASCSICMKPVGHVTYARGINIAMAKNFDTAHVNCGNRREMVAFHCHGRVAVFITLDKVVIKHWIQDESDRLPDIDT